MSLKNYGRNQKKRKEYIQQGRLMFFLLQLTIKCKEINQ